MSKIKFIVLMAIMTISTLAFGADGEVGIGKVAKELGEQVNLVTQLMVYGATLIGIVFLIVGGLNLKKHGDNPQQVPISKPLIFLTAGALLFGLGSTSELMQSTLFGDGGGREAESENGTFKEFKEV